MTSAPAPDTRIPFDLQTGEHVLLFCRRHFMFLYPRLALLFFATLVPPIVVAFIVRRTTGLGGGAGKVALILALVWLVYWSIRTYFTWYKYNHDIWVVTNQRIVDFQKPNWIKQSMASADLVYIEDMAIHKNGVFATAFNFGDVRCQTAGEQANFVLSGIPKPEKVLSLIDATRDAARREIARPLGRQ